jgi:hypothetical protein
LDGGPLPLAPAQWFDNPAVVVGIEKLRLIYEVDGSCGVALGSAEPPCRTKDQRLRDHA